MLHTPLACSGISVTFEMLLIRRTEDGNESYIKIFLASRHWVWVTGSSETKKSRPALNPFVSGGSRRVKEAGRWAETFHVMCLEYFYSALDEVRDYLVTGSLDKLDSCDINSV
jgi:hypothetical protein